MNKRMLTCGLQGLAWGRHVGKPLLNLHQPPTCPRRRAIQNQPVLAEAWGEQAGVRGDHVAGRQQQMGRAVGRAAVEGEVEGVWGGGGGASLPLTS